MSKAIISDDSAHPDKIQGHPAAVLPYADGRYKWSHSLFPHSRFRYITVFGDHRIASIFDIEPGCIWPPEKARVPIQNRIRDFPHDKAIAYTFRDAVPAVREALNGLDWHLFIATLDGEQLREFDGIPTIACQFQGGPRADADLSIWWDENSLHHPNSPANRN